MHTGNQYLHGFGHFASLYNTSHILKIGLSIFNIIFRVKNREFKNSLRWLSRVSI